MIDRRHVVLGVALAASVATRTRGPPSLFSGYQTLDAEPVSLDETQLIRTWLVTVDVTLPAKAADHDFDSIIEVQAHPSASGSEEGSADLLVVVLSECGSGGVADGPNGAPRVAVEGSFSDCVAQETCTRTFCVAIGSASDHAVDVEWSTRATIRSFASVDEDVDSITVPIDITIEESAP